MILPSTLLDVPENAPEWVKNKFQKWRELGGFWGVVPVDKPQTSFPPVHPLYLSLVYKIFGPNPLASRIIQALLSAVTTIILYHFTRKVLDPETAFVTYLIAAFYPYYIYYTGVLLNETISIFLLILSFWIFELMKEKDKIIYPLMFGFLLTLLVLARSVFLLFFIIALALVLLTIRKGLKKAALMTLAFIVTVSPWVIRNYNIYNQIIIMPTKGGWNLWERNNYRLNPDFLEIEHPELKKSFKIISDSDKKNLKRRDLTFYPDLKGKNEPERDEIFKNMFKEFVKANPVIYLKLCHIRAFEFFRITHMYIDGYVYKVLAWLSAGLMMILGSIGGLFLLKRWRNLLVLYLLIAYYIPIHILTTSEPRYRLMIEFIFIIFSSYIIKFLFTKTHIQINPAIQVGYECRG